MKYHCETLLRLQNFGGGSARSSGRVKTKSVTWVEGDLAQVALEVVNTLGVEVKISNIALIYEGVELEVKGSTVLLDSHQGDMQPSN